MREGCNLQVSITVQGALVESRDLFNYSPSKPTPAKTSQAKQLMNRVSIAAGHLTRNKAKAHARLLPDASTTAAGIVAEGRQDEPEAKK